MINPNLRTRSSYSFFNSLLKVKDIVDFAIDNNFKEAFLIEKNYLFSTMEFYFLCQKNKIKPIIGLEIDYSNLNKIIIAKNEKGYRKLLEISSIIGLENDLNIDLLKDPNLIMIAKNFSINGYLRKEDKETLKMFSKISNENINIEEYSHLQKQIDTEQEKYIKNIIEKINLEIKFKKNVIPKFFIKKNEKIDSKNYFKNLIDESLKKLFLLKNINEDIYKKRAQQEFETITQMNYEDYFLIVWDIVKWAKNNNIIVGPGRGSVGGSLIAFLLEITTIDPIQNDLLFERFLNPERVSMPDIDLDFEDTKRELVIDYIQNKYGKNHVAHIITFQTLRARSSIKDVARLQDISPTDAESISKLIPENLTLEEAYNTNKKFRLFIESKPQYKKVYESAKLIEGLPRQHSTHAAGIVLSDEPLYYNTPIKKGFSSLNLSQYSMDYMEINGLLKIDILGLRNLSFLRDIIKNTDKEKISPSENFDDKEVYELLTQGKTSGIFQLESPGMIKVLKQLKPTKFEDIVVTLSLYRPGPLKEISHYIKRKHNQEKIEYFSDDVKNILESTYGIIVYQEQVMQIVQKVAGFSLAKSDILRRAIGKKESKILLSLKSDFMKGSSRNGYDEKLSNKIFNWIEEFANYGFNRSHAFAYAIVSYQIAFLKTTYPLSFFIALLNANIGNNEKIKQYIYEAISENIEYSLPNINFSISNFEKKDNKISFGFRMMKGIGEVAINEILRTREEKIFESYLDFIVRTSNKKINTTNIDLLISSGALDCFKLSRNTMLENKEKILKYAEMIKVKDVNGKEDFDYTILDPPQIIESKIKDNIQNFELKAFGFVLSKSDKTFNKDIFQKYNATLMNEINFVQDKNYIVIGNIKSIRKIVTKTNREMAFSNIEDHTGNLNLTLWPAVFTRYQNILKENSNFLIEGKIDIKRAPTLIVSKIIEIK